MAGVLPDRHVGRLQPRSGQHDRTTIECGFVGLAQVVEHHPQRGTIRVNVVQGQGQHMRTLRLLDQVHSQHRTLMQIECLLRLVLQDE